MAYALRGCAAGRAFGMGTLRDAEARSRRDKGRHYQPVRHRPGDSRRTRLRRRLPATAAAVTGTTGRTSSRRSAPDPERHFGIAGGAHGRRQGATPHVLRPNARPRHDAVGDVRRRARQRH